MAATVTESAADNQVAAHTLADTAESVAASEMVEALVCPLAAGASGSAIALVLVS